MNKAELEALVESQRQQITALTESGQSLADQLAEARKAPEHEHDLAPIGAPYEKAEVGSTKKTDRMRLYQTLYCRRCPQTYEIVVANHNSGGPR